MQARVIDEANTCKVGLCKTFHRRSSQSLAQQPASSPTCTWHTRRHQQSIRPRPNRINPAPTIERPSAWTRLTNIDAPFVYISRPRSATLSHTAHPPRVIQRLSAEAATRRATLTCSSFHCTVQATSSHSFAPRRFDEARIQPYYFHPPIITRLACHWPDCLCDTHSIPNLVSLED